MLVDMATVLINGFLYTAAGNALLLDMGGLVYQLHNSQKSNTFHSNNIPCTHSILDPLKFKSNRSALQFPKTNLTQHRKFCLIDL